MKITLNGVDYDIAENGIGESGATLTLSIVKDTNTFENVEKNIKAHIADSDTIYVKDDNGETVRSITGYVVYKSMQRVKDVTIRTMTIQPKKGGEQPTTKAITGDIFRVVITKLGADDQITTINNKVALVEAAQVDTMTAIANLYEIISKS